MTPSTDRLTAARAHAKILALLSVLTLYYAFVSSAGTFSTIGWNTEFYDMLAEGMRAGHLYIPVEPSPELLARPDPYAWETGDDWDAWLWDASLYNGRYYIYWGPTPGLFLLLFKLVTGFRGTVHDQWLVLFFMLMRLYAGSALLVSYARSHDSWLPSWALQLAILVFGLASPTPYFLARPQVYEASIAGGQGCLFVGLWLAYQGLLRPLTQTRWFVAAGSFFALALGSRGSVILVVPLLIVVTALAAQRSAGYAFRGLVRSGLALGVPVGVGLGLYAIYNQLRFDSFYEFGLKYQLTGRPFGNENQFFLPNLVAYLTNAIHWSCKFPFVRLPRERELSHLISWPGGYDIGDADNGERAAGILFATTICWLWCVWLWRALVSFKRAYTKSPALSRAPVACSTRELWLLGCSLCLIVALAPASRMWMANMRFLEDAAGGILLGALGAALWLMRPVHARDRSRARLRRLFGRPLYIVLAVHTIFVGVGLGFTGHMDTFAKENPPLFQQLERKLSVCRWKRLVREAVARTVETSDDAPLPVACRDAPR